MKKVLLVGSSYSAVPLLYHLKSYGCTVGVCGNLERDQAIAHADSYHKLDYSKKEDLLALVERERFDHIVPSCNDFSYLSCAWVADRLGYPGYDGYETAVTLHTKAAFRSFALRNGLPVPNAVRPRFPVLVKPIDSFSGRGMTKVRGRDGLARAVDHAKANSRTGRYLIEEFVEGTLHSHSAFLARGKITADVFVDEYCKVYPYEVDCSCLSVALSEKTKDHVRQAVREMLSLLRIENGLVHTQFVADRDRFWLIETMRRAPGDLYGRLVELSTEAAYHKNYVSPFIGMKPPEKTRARRGHFFARHTVSSDESGDFVSFSHDIPSRNVFIVPLKTSGQMLKAAPYDKVAILFAGFQSREDLSKYTPVLDSHVHIQTSGSN